MIPSIKFLITITTSAAIAEWFDILNGYGNEWGPIWPEIIKGINMDGTNFRRRHGFHTYPCVRCFQILTFFKQVTGRPSGN